MQKRKQQSRAKPQAKQAVKPVKPKANRTQKQPAKQQVKQAVKPAKKQTAKKPSEKTAGKQTKQSKSSLFKFRRYKKIEGGKNKKAKHPKLIVEETAEEFGFMGLTEDPKSGHHSNIPLTKNPKQGDSRKAFLRKELRYDNRDNFAEILADYNLSEEDKLAVIKYIEKRKKKK